MWVLTAGMHRCANLQLCVAGEAFASFAMKCSDSASDPCQGKRGEHVFSDKCAGTLEL